MNRNVTPPKADVLARGLNAGGYLHGRTDSLFGLVWKRDPRFSPERIDPGNEVDEAADLYLAEGRVAGMGRQPDGFTVEQEIDAGGQIVCPGLIDTPIWHRSDKNFGMELGDTVNMVVQSSIDSMQLKIPRAGKPEEIAAATAFLCSEDAAYITGQAINVCGGMENH